MKGDLIMLVERLPRLLLACLLLSACTANPVLDPHEISGETANYQQHTEVDDGDRAELMAESAYLAGSQVYIRYRRDTVTGHATAGLAEEPGFPETVTALPANDEAAPPAREPALVRVDEAIWIDGLSAGSEVLPVLAARHWKAAFRSLRDSLTPRETGQGTVFDICERSELISWRDDSGTLQSTLLRDKPAGVRVESSYRFERVRAMLLPLVDAQLEGSGIESRKALLNTGDTGPRSVPFVYVDRDDGQLLFLSCRSGSEPTLVAKNMLVRLRAIGHVIAGQVSSLVERPVTSIGRLFARANNAVIDGINRTVTVDRHASRIPPLSDERGMDLQEWERRLDEITGMPAAMGRMSYLVDGVEFFPRFIDAIQSARDSIDVRMYIFDDDDYAIKIADILKARSGEVDVRLLLDGLGTISSAARGSSTLPSSHKAPLSIFNYLTKDSGIRVQGVANFWLGGDHAKSIIVDGRTGFVGGMNIGREYRYEWHDLMVELAGPVVDILHEDFHKAWVHEKFLGDLQLLIRNYQPAGRGPRPGDYPIRVLFTRAADSQIYRTQLEAIRNARKRIYIENAYFTDDLILHELIKARMRGVDVRVIVPLRSDFRLMKRNNMLAANTMLEHGIRVYIYPGMSHVKAAVYDGWICLGSANLDKLSLRINKEINIATSHEQAVQGLMERVFIPDMQASAELKEPFPGKGLDFLVEYISDHL